tara:strand:+ start:523 stop:993 length:471 start_codon:yes stop_codon:yes gene_type:complete
MKTKYKISSKLQFTTEQVKDVYKFAARMAKETCVSLNRKVPLQVNLKVFASTHRTRSGRATINTGRGTKTTRSVDVFLRMGRGFSGYTERYHRYADSPTMHCEGDLDVFVHLMGHELGHAICGFEGDKIGEFQCERFAARVVEAYRNMTQDPAAMI